MFSSTKTMAFLLIILAIILNVHSFIWSRSHPNNMYAPSYYPYSPYPISPSILSNSSPSYSHLEQAPIQSNTDSYRYNWYNYLQNFPHTSTLFPSSNPQYYPTPSVVSTHQTPGAGSLFRSWWTRKMSKFGLQASGSSPCHSYWNGSGIGNGPCVDPSLCCLPQSVVQTAVEPVRPYHTESALGSSSVTYPTTSYYYSNTYKPNTLAPQSSDNVELVSSSS